MNEIDSLYSVVLASVVVDRQERFQLLLCSTHLIQNESLAKLLVCWPVIVFCALNLFNS